MKYQLSKQIRLSSALLRRWRSMNACICHLCTRMACRVVSNSTHARCMGADATGRHPYQLSARWQTLYQCTHSRWGAIKCALCTWSVTIVRGTSGGRRWRPEWQWHELEHCEGGGAPEEGDGSRETMDGCIWFIEELFKDVRCICVSHTPDSTSRNITKARRLPWYSPLCCSWSHYSGLSNDHECF